MPLQLEVVSKLVDLIGDFDQVTNVVFIKHEQWINGRIMSYLMYENDRIIVHLPLIVIKVKLINRFESSVCISLWNPPRVLEQNLVECSLVSYFTYDTCIEPYLREDLQAGVLEEEDVTVYILVGLEVLVSKREAPRDELDTPHVCYV